MYGECTVYWEPATVTRQRTKKKKREREGRKHNSFSGAAKDGISKRKHGKMPCQACVGAIAGARTRQSWAKCPDLERDRHRNVGTVQNTTRMSSTCSCICTWTWRSAAIQFTSTWRGTWRLLSSPLLSFLSVRLSILALLALLLFHTTQSGVHLLLQLKPFLSLFYEDKSVSQFLLLSNWFSFRTPLRPLINHHRPLIPSLTLLLPSPLASAIVFHLFYLFKLLY